MNRRTNLWAIAAVLVITLGLNANAEDAHNRPAVLPSLSAIIALHGKPTISPEFLDVQRRCGLKLFSRKQTLNLAYYGVKPLAPGHYEVATELAYGGSGIVVVARSVSDVETDLGRAREHAESIVEKIQLIVGDCDERYVFGVWKGEMPPIEIPATPEALLKKYPGHDSDVRVVTYGNAAVIDKNPRGLQGMGTRIINYYVPPMWTGFPYSFIFNGDKLAMIEVWPQTTASKVVPKPAKKR